MTSRDISLQRKHSRIISLPFVLNSTRFRFRLIRLLLVVSKLIALMILISLAVTFYAQFAPTQTDNLPGILTGKPEIVELRSAYANHYDMGNERYMAFVGADPLNYQDANGDWQSIKPTFTEVEGGWQVTENTLRSAFADDTTTFRIESGGYGFFWQPAALEINNDDGQAWQLATPRSGSKIKAEAHDNLLRYTNAWSDLSLVEQFKSASDSLEQELILANPPEAVGEGEWLSLRVDLTLPGSVVIMANGQIQTGEFTTQGALTLQAADGNTLLTLLPPQAYEENDPLTATGGRYRVVPQPNSLTLWVQTPLNWWLNPERNYPAVLDPTMQVLRPLEVATIGYPYDGSNPDAFVWQQEACVGLTSIDSTTGVWHLQHYWSDRGYVKFKLPNLPDGAVADQATLVAAPDTNRAFDLFWSPLHPIEDTLVYRVTQDWSFLEGLTSISKTTVITHAPTEIDRAQIPFHISINEFDPKNRPVTQWDVTGDVQGWYADPSSNYGLALISEYDGHHLDPFSPEDQHSFLWNCFPKTSMDILDDVLANPGNPTARAPGIGLLIEYTSPQLAANDFRTVKVPSAVTGDMYEDQHHEYIPPATSGWQLMAARGVRGGQPPKTSLKLIQVEPTDPDLDGLISDSGSVKEGETNIYFSEYVVANYHQSLPSDLRLLVLEDTNADELTDDNRLYFLQTAEAASSPVIVVETPISIPMPLDSGFIVGQELDLSASTTVEIKVPYGELPAEMFNLQLFPPGLKYGSRNLPGIQLTEGPDAWEIEMVVPTGQNGTWLLAAINDGEFSPPGPTLNAQVTACENTAEVIKYPVDGDCVELQTPPSSIPSDLLYQNGNVRIYSPLGFTDPCGDGTCNTVEQDKGQAVMAFIGYVGDDDNWVAVKGGRFEIANNVITTTSDVRLIMAHFNEGPPITLPVLRGEFQVNNGTGVISSKEGTDIFPLVKMPLPDMNNGTWTYTIELTNAVMRAEGKLQRIIEPTQSPTPSPTNFNFNAQWSITARGGQDLAGGTTLANSPGEFNVGTLIVDPAPVDAYMLEYDPAHISNIPQAIPEFLHIRLTNAALKQPTNLGGTQVPVQAVILNPGKSVMDEKDSPVGLYCGADVTCFDLRGEGDTMTPSKNIDRGYRMPDLIIQDNAGTVMINTPEGVEIYSRDHPEASLRADDYSFSYEAFGATISTYHGVCPPPRDPLNPEKILDGNGQLTTVVEGSATLSVPNAESTSGGPQIGVEFTLCENSMREMAFIFSTGDQTALPLGNSGLFMNLIRGRISLAPEQGPQPGYTTVTMEVGVRGMSPDSTSSNVFVLGMVTIDTRGLFDMQLQAGLKVVGGYGVGVDGHFWVAWAPLDLGFEVQACAPYSEGFNAVDWTGHRCDGNELLFGELRAHIWQGQGWQHKYDWLPDNDDMHIAARYKVDINIATGMIVDTAFVVIPPADVQLYEFTMAFGEFCTNQACTSYEWGVTGAYTILGYDFGIYYGFDSGLDFILGSGNYLLIDEAGGSSIASSKFGNVDITSGRSPYTVNIPEGTPSAMFTLGWDPGAAIVLMDLSLHSPSGTVYDKYIIDPAVTVTTTPTSKGYQTVIVVEDPEAGDWQIYTDGPTPLPPHQLLYVANKPEPTLVLADIPYLIHPGDVINLEWVSNISETDTAWLSLYYTTTDAIMGEDQEIGGPIVERLPLTPSGSYEWNVKGLAYVDNDYDIYARIDSEATSEINACGADYEYNPDPASSEASCAMLNSNLVLPAANIPDLATFWYEDEDAPVSPTMVGAQAVDWTSIMVLWEPNAEVDIAGYLVRCTQASEIRTARVPAQHMAGTNEYESAQVNGLRPYQISTCSVRAYDTSGNISGDSGSAVVVPEIVISDTTISPESSATLTSVNEKITAVFPGAIVESDTLIKLITRSLPPHPIGPLEFGGTGFNLSAYGPNGIPVTQFLGDFSVEVSYSEVGDTSVSAGRAETLNLYWWDGDAWQGVLPCEGCHHDVEGQRFIVVLDHLSEFAVLSGELPLDYIQYLPLITKR